MDTPMPLHRVGALGPTAYWIFALGKILVVFTAVMITVALLTLLERKLSAWIQDRIGPNRVGPGGLLQPVADGLKNLLKEETQPAEAARGFFTLAPMLAIMPALVLFAVVPLAAPLPTPLGLVEMSVAEVPVGILFVLALSSLGVYGITLAGWASANKYAFLGGLRAAAQLISYEVSLGMSLLPVFLVVGDVTLSEMVARQQQMHLWFALPLCLPFFLFWVASFAETNRLPFDLPEAESELITGYHTEYSSMKFSMFFIAEYAHVLTVSMIMATVFLGGWDIPLWQGDNMWVVADGVVAGAAPAWWKTVLTHFSFLLKTGFFVGLFMIVRWTLPRFRYDQVMDLGWKVMLPVSLVSVAVNGGAVLLLERLRVPYGLGYGLMLTAINLPLLALVLWGLDRGRVLTGTGSLQQRRLAAQAKARARRAAAAA